MGNCECHNCELSHWNITTIIPLNHQITRGYINNQRVYHSWQRQEFGNRQVSQLGTIFRLDPFMTSCHGSFSLRNRIKTQLVIHDQSPYSAGKSSTNPGFGWISDDFLFCQFSQWEFQDPKLKVLYHIRPYFVVICGDIHLHRPKK